MTSLSKRTTVGAAILLLGATMLVLFQNCGQGFQVSELASERLRPLDVPALTFKTKPPTLTNLKSFDVEFGISTDPRAKLESATCQVDTMPQVNCISGRLPLVDLADGDHTIRINAKDSQGQRTEELVAIFRVDTTPPVITLIEKPASVTGSTTAKFAMTVIDTLSEVSAVECSSAEPAVYTACQTPATHSLTVAPGARVFRIRARDKAGNTSVEATYNWTVDLTAPILSIVRPANFIRSKSVSIAFSGTDDGQAITDFECQFDGGGFAACTSPKAYTALAEGSRTFEVRGRDTAQNLSAPISVMFTVDSIAPSTPIVTTAISSPAKVTKPQIAFTSTDASSGIAGYTCAFDNGAFVDCVSPYTYDVLSDGVRVLKVKSKDLAGNESAVGSVSLTIDTTPPTLSISSTQSPPAQTTAKTVSIGFTALDTGSGIKLTECLLDAGMYVSCSSPINVTTGLGAHTLTVRATDNVGLTSTATHTWTTVDVAPQPTATPVPVGDGWIVPTITFTQGATTTFDLNTTLPASVVKGGTFGVDTSVAANKPLPSGMSLNTNGVIMLGTAAVGDTSGVVFTYTEP